MLVGRRLLPRDHVMPEPGRRRAERLLAGRRRAPREVAHEEAKPVNRRIGLSLSQTVGEGTEVASRGSRGDPDLRVRAALPALVEVGAHPGRERLVEREEVRAPSRIGDEPDVGPSTQGAEEHQVNVGVLPGQHEARQHVSIRVDGHVPEAKPGEGPAVLGGLDAKGEIEVAHGDTGYR